jgi:hypothetical protein
MWLTRPLQPAIPYNPNALDFLNDSDESEQEFHGKGFRRIFTSSSVPDECQRGPANRLKSELTFADSV